MTGNRILAIKDGARTTSTFDVANQNVYSLDANVRTAYTSGNRTGVEKPDGSNVIVAVQTQEPGACSNLISQYRLTNGVWLPSYHHYDALGNTTELTDNTENATDTYDYNAWGEILARTGTTLNPFQYRGRYGYFLVTDTGEIYVIMRTYDPVAGRWTTLDLLKFVNGMNMYLAYFVPNGVDPSGTDATICSDGSHVTVYFEYELCINGTKQKTIVQTSFFGKGCDYNHNWFGAIVGVQGQIEVGQPDKGAESTVLPKGKSCRTFSGDQDDAQRAVNYINSISKTNANSMMHTSLRRRTLQISDSSGEYKMYSMGGKNCIDYGQKVIEIYTKGDAAFSDYYFLPSGVLDNPIPIPIQPFGPRPFYDGPLAPLY